LWTGPRRQLSRNGVTRRLNGQPTMDVLRLSAIDLEVIAETGLGLAYWAMKVGVTHRELLSSEEVLLRLEYRLGRVHARLRLGLEREHEAQAFGQGLTFLHLENMPVMQALIEVILRGTGTYWRGRSNAARVVLNRNVVCLPSLPASFDAFTILHLSDLHADMSQRALGRAAELLDGLEYDLCVLTGAFAVERTATMDQRSSLSPSCEIRCTAPSMAYSAIMTRSRWFLILRLWASPSSSTNASPFDEARMRSTSRASTTRISIVRTTSRRRRRKFQSAAFPSFCPTRRRSIAKRLTPDST
jgi:hypothetical protein